MDDHRNASTGEQAGSSKGYVLTEYLAILQSWKNLATALLISITVISVITAFILPPVYESETRLMPVGESDLMGSSRFQTLSQFAGFVDFASIAGGGSARNSLVSILDSDQLRVRVARALNLAERYGVDHPDSSIRHVLAGRVLRDKLTFAINKYDNIVITAEAEDPDLVIGILDETIAQVATIQNQMNLSTARQTRQFVERRMGEARATLRDAQISLTKFQNEYGIIAVVEQQAAMVELVARLETEMTLKKAELSAARNFYGGQSSRIRQLEAEIQALDNQLQRILRPGEVAPGEPAAEEPAAEKSAAGGSAADESVADEVPADGLAPDQPAIDDAGVWSRSPSLREMPDLAAEYARLAMDVEIQQSLLALLAQQYEQAKINEVREVSSFEVVDPPRDPPKPTRTKKKIVLAGFIVAVILAAALPILIDSLDRYFPGEARREARDLLRSLLTRRSS